jgi:hypothetical protein
LIGQSEFAVHIKRLDARLRVSCRWRTFQVGETCFNDDAVRRTGKCFCVKRSRYTIFTAGFFRRGCHTANS